MTSQLLIALILVPVIGCLASILTPKKWERTIFAIVMTTIAVELGLFMFLGWRWLDSGMEPVSASMGTLYATSHYAFTLDFYFDKLSAIFLSMATLTTTLVFIFSKYYMHREQGFKRFYYTLLLFFIGLCFVILAGNFEVLFVGWEFIGISSVLLIAFYRDRFLPARNALKVFSVYRIADAFLLAAIWYAHDIFAKSVHFSELGSVVAAHGDQLVLVGLLLLVAAVIKSAQFPFSYWLPRAMEGPTTSSAIFYGALSVHMGVFLLLRTSPIWDDSTWLKIVIAAVGLITALVASSITRVQSSTKTQIAYASITQIGIMFIEIAAGLYWLALIHFVCNALLRMYQLLISPSVVGYLVHDQFFRFVLPTQKIKNTFTGRVRATLYVLGIKEWNMNTAMNQFIWRPLKFIGRMCAFLDAAKVQLFALFVFTGALLTTLLTDVFATVQYPAYVVAIVGVVLYIRAYTTKNTAQVCWNLIMLGNLFSMLFLVLASNASWGYALLYLAGVAVAFIAGHMCLHYLGKKGQSTSLRSYQGSIFAFKKLGHVFFIVCLLFIAFPISPSFLAQEALIGYIPVDHALQIALFCAAYVLVGISAMRLYTKIFFGPHKTGHHEIAYKSS